MEGIQGLWCVWDVLSAGGPCPKHEVSLWLQQLLVSLQSFLVALRDTMFCSGQICKYILELIFLFPANLVLLQLSSVSWENHS